MQPADIEVPDLSAILGQQGTLDGIGEKILTPGGPRAIRYRETRKDGKTMVFVAHHEDVIRVLTNEDDFSLCHYNPLYSAISPPGAFVIMRPEGPKRQERLAILKAAAARTLWFGPEPEHRRELARACVDQVLTSLHRRRRFDLIGEYGFFVPFLVAKQILGMSGPRSFDLLTLMICVANGHSVLQLFRPETRPYLTDLVWSEIVIAQLLKNFENRTLLIRIVSRYAASRLRKDTERYIDAAQTAPNDGTLLSALWSTKRDFPLVRMDDYREHIVSIMMELVSTLLLVPGAAFTGILDRWLTVGGPGLDDALQLLGPLEAEAFVQEQLRLAPPEEQLLRNTARGGVRLGELTLEEGDYVCTLIKSAGTDVAASTEVKGDRCPSAYIHFGPEKGPHRCFGHLLAPAVLAEMFLGLKTLPHLAPRSGLTAWNGSVPGRWIFAFGEPFGT